MEKSVRAAMKIHHFGIFQMLYGLTGCNSNSSSRVYSMRTFSGSGGGVGGLGSGGGVNTNGLAEGLNVNGLAEGLNLNELILDAKCY